MRPTVLSAILLVLPNVHAADEAKEPAAVELLRKAVAAQGALPEQGLRDIQITFEGKIREPEEGEHSITRKYWFRGGDRSFRIQTYANAARANTRSERGVLGGAPEEFWEWARDERMRLRPTNREHKKNVEAIRRDRADFERILRMVVLARAEDRLSAIRLGNPPRAGCDDDHPNSRRFIFPDSEKGAEYLVLDLERSGTDPLRLYLHETKLTVAKVVQFDRRDRDTPRFVYYLGGYRRVGDLLIPHYVSVHTAVPTAKTTEETTQLAGRLTIAINQGLGDDVFAARPGKPEEKSSRKKDS